MVLKVLSSKLVEQVYDTALEPAGWPALLERLVEEIPIIEEAYEEEKTASGELRSIGNTLTKTTMYQDLLAHLTRAAQIRLKLNNEEQNACIQASVFEKIPMEAILLSKTGEVKHCNRYAKSFLENTHLMMLHNHKLFFTNQSNQDEFDQFINEIRIVPSDKKQFDIILKADFQPQRVTISLSHVNDLYDLDGDILLLISLNNVTETIDIIEFANQYHLTKAETRVAHHLLESRSLNEISKAHKVSIHTIRSQLKSIFQKTYCRSQSDLIKLILLSQPVTLKTENASLVEPLFTCYNQQIIYADDRVLSFSDLGPKKGLPVIAFPPTSGSRLQVHPDISVLFDLNIRLITIDKPGFGRSTPIINDNLQYVAEYIEALADQLFLESFALLGFCGGSIHALSGASMLGDRVLHTTLISAITPYQSVDLFKGSNSSHFTDLATRMPEMLHPLLTLSMSRLMKEPGKYYAQLFPCLCDSDEDALSKSDFNDNFLLAFRECMRQGPKAFCEELVLLNRFWGINFSEVYQPITFWHGKEDHYVPIHLIRLFSDEFANAELIEVEEHGHFMIYYQWFEILQDLKSKATMDKR